MKGELIVKDTLDPLVENGEKVQAIAEFVAEKEEGEVYVDFIVDTTGLIGKEIVAFETLYNVEGLDDEQIKTPKDVEENGKPIAEHKDPEDKSQTVKVKEPKIGTYLADDANNKKITESETTTLIDTVAFKSLKVGETYAVVGELIVKESGDPLVENGTPVKAVGYFTPEEENGSTEVAFVVNTKGMAGKHLVAFETLYNLSGLDDDEADDLEKVEENGKKIAEHKDITDKDQTVVIKVPKAPKKPRTPDTGDNNGVILYGFGGVLTAALAALVAMMRKRKAQGARAE